MDPETEVGIWAQITGLDVTAVRHKPPLIVNDDSSVSVFSVSTTIDGHETIPCDLVELQIGGVWDDERGIERELGGNGSYTVTSGTVKLTLE